MRATRLTTSVALAAMLAGCATPATLLTPSITGMRASTAHTAEETDITFAGVNAEARGDTITRLTLSKAALDEAAFAPVIDADTAARWQNAFAQIDAYLAALNDLVDPSRSAAVGADINGVATNLGGSAVGLKLPDGVAGLLGTLGGDLVQAISEKKAQAAMQHTDPAFHALLYHMADLVGAPSGDRPAPGTLLHAVDEHWVNVLSGIENDYKHLTPTSSDDDRRAILVRYATALDGRDLDHQQLAKLRQALMAIAEAHHAAAQADPGAELFWLGQIADALGKAADTVKSGS